MPSYQYRKSHCGDYTIARLSCFYNGLSYTGKISLHWHHMNDEEYHFATPRTSQLFDQKFIYLTNNIETVKGFSLRDFYVGNPPTTVGFPSERARNGKVISYHGVNIRRHARHEPARCYDAPHDIHYVRIKTKGLLFCFVLFFTKKYIGN